MESLCVNELPSAEAIQNRVNASYDSLYHATVDGERKPYVCCICDKLLVSEKDNCHITVASMKKMKKHLCWDNIPDEHRSRNLEEQFRLTPDTRDLGITEDLDFLNTMALSPRGILYKKQCNPVKKDGKKKPGRGRVTNGFSACKRCKTSTGKRSGGSLPRHAIVNRNYIGGAPACLLELTDVELAFISPVKHYGYCFTWQGGKQLKGTCTFMRVEKRSIGVAVAKVEGMGFNKHVLVLFSGHMTKLQKKRSKERSTIRTDKIIAAVEWLCKNNRRWSSVNFKALCESLQGRKPVIYDRSSEVENDNANIEDNEVLTCYYPDGATCPSNGGCDNPEHFKKYVQDMAEQGYDVEFQANLKQEFMNDSEGDLLLDACLLQFPCGVGGLKERRKLQDGSWTCKSDYMEFIRELSLNSQPQFHSNLFQLILYSLASKHRLLSSSRLQLRGKTDAHNLAEGLNVKDVISCITGRRRKNRITGANASKKFLNAVDATAKALPHTNEASKAARGLGEAMQHHFGMGSVFLTVTFDDENSLIMQVMTREEIHNKNMSTDGMTDAELSELVKKRRELRLKFPGIAALNFELLMDILFKEVVGWDVEAMSATEREGFFGHPNAVSYAVEEQGRKTLHVHMTLWIRGYKDLQKAYFFGKDKKKRDAKAALREYSEHVASTKLFPTDTNSILKAFNHDCTETCYSKRGVPVVTDEQSLRNLRHRYGHKDSKGVFATCPHCYKQWTYEDLVSMYLLQTEGFCQRTGAEGSGVPVDDVMVRGTQRLGAQVPKARCYGKVMDFTNSESETAVPPEACINVACQSHLSCHSNSCFKCQKKGSKKRGHICGPTCECRYRLPDKKRARAEILEENNSIDWFSWNGDAHKQPLAQILPKRGQYDLFQNASCNAISHSKFACNSNISLILDGPIGQYMHKYQEKENQDEETAECKEVEAAVKKFAGDRKHEHNRPEALRRMCRAAFAHNKRNVISGSFASFLLRHDSRFYYSAHFQFCPLRDLVRLHNHQDINADLKYTPSGDCFFENLALDYLCRGEQLADVGLADFTEKYYTKHVPKKNDDTEEVIPFAADTGHYQHPSVLKTGFRRGKCSHGSAERSDRVLFRVSQWMFPDTACFKTNILTCREDEFKPKMEEHSQLVLSLFYPHRSSADLKALGKTDYPCLHKLRQVYCMDQQRHQYQETPVVFTDRNVAFLQNAQDCRSNALRFKITDDALTRGTVAYESPNPQEGDSNKDNAEQEPEETTYEDFADLLQEDFGAPLTTDNDPEFLNETLRNFDFKHMRDKGKNNCGCANDLEMSKLEEDVSDFVEFHTDNNTSSASNAKTDKYPEGRQTHTIQDIVKLHLRKAVPKTKRNVFEGKHIDVHDATGSIKSVREWSKAAFNADRKQQRAFEVLISAFLMTFYEEKPEDATDATREAGDTRSKYRRTRKALQRLRGCREEYNLVCLLHGPGGSGKTTVIDMVKAHAKSYCKMLGHPHTDRTIIVTAMSGVAATLLNGETTHSVLGLNRDTVQNEECHNWIDARLLIVDECSFASASDFQKMHEHLKFYMQDHYGMYGGLNIVFAGDFSQLEPVNRDPMCKNDNHCAEFHGFLNCYIELNGKWRFMKDPAWGDKMSRVRKGEPTDDDICEINRDCHVCKKSPPVGIQVATHTNKDRDAVNSSMFDEWTKANKPTDDSPLLGACVVFMDDLHMNDSSKTKVPVTSNSVKRHFYQNCTESECNYGAKSKGRLDPVLKLYMNAPLMLTKNSDVANGEANGSRVFAKNAQLKTGETTFLLRLDNGTTVQAVCASQVQHINVEHENQDICPRRFAVTAETFHFMCKLEVATEELFVSISGTAFPIISNSCATGHKLQGCTVESLLVNDWYYGANWACVVLSRVRTMAGLCLRRPLSRDLTKYKKPETMKRMLKKFEETIAVNMLSPEEHEELENTVYVEPQTPSPPGTHDTFDAY